MTVTTKVYIPRTGFKILNKHRHPQNDEAASDAKAVDLDEKPVNMSSVVS